MFISSVLEINLFLTSHGKFVFILLQLFQQLYLSILDVFSHVWMAVCIFACMTACMDHCVHGCVDTQNGNFLANVLL